MPIIIMNNKPKDKQHILVTGGAGYIGSHTTLALLNQGYAVTVVDNLCNASEHSLHRIAEITGHAPAFHQLDIRDTPALTTLMQQTPFDAVIHFAALKAVGESVEHPLRYYQNNITGTLSLCEAMAATGTYRIVFSSSATVYGMPEKVPIREDAPLQTLNPYGRTKLMMESILSDLYTADPRWQVALLRYFNPIGAHPSGKIGEDPHGIPNNLLPFVAQVAVGRRPFLQIFGNDYPTPDGTGIRDYIHVVDLADGHLKALETLQQESDSVLICNLGTGKGYSVLEVVKAFEKASGREIPYQFAPRRSGDAATCYADPTYAEQRLGWKASFGIEEMCRDVWKWQSANPNGYQIKT